MTTFVLLVAAIIVAVVILVALPLVRAGTTADPPARWAALAAAAVLVFGASLLYVTWSNWKWQAAPEANSPQTMVARLARQLEKDGLKTTAIHGDKSQAARLEALDDFKAAKVQVMVATDVAARGLDIDDLPLVVNYELPYVPEDYIHRIGRTGRAGASGEAISFCAPEEEKLLAEIERLLKRSIPVVAANLEPVKPEPRPRRESQPARAARPESRVDSEAQAPRRQRDESVFDLNPDQPLTPRQPERVTPGALTSTNSTPRDPSRRAQPIAALLMKRSSPEPEKV